MKAVPVALVIVLMTMGVHAGEPDKPRRSSTAVRQFKAIRPCPETGDHRGACPGWIIDHVVPLCAGGSDTPDNMQWQTVESSYIKDRQERKQCRELKKVAETCLSS